MRTWRGMALRSSEIRKLEQTRTKRVAAPMARPLMALLVTASDGHMPSTWTKTGFSRHRPLVNSA